MPCVKCFLYLTMTLPYYLKFNGTIAIQYDLRETYKSPTFLICYWYLFLYIFRIQLYVMWVMEKVSAPKLADAWRVSLIVVTRIWSWSHLTCRFGLKRCKSFVKIITLLKIENQYFLSQLSFIKVIYTAVYLFQTCCALMSPLAKSCRYILLNTIPVICVWRSPVPCVYMYMCVQRYLFVCLVWIEQFWTHYFLWKKLKDICLHGCCSIVSYMMLRKSIIFHKFSQRFCNFEVTVSIRTIMRVFLK